MDVGFSGDNPLKGCQKNRRGPIYSFHDFEYLPVVHGEYIFGNSSKLHYYILSIRIMNYLKILYWRLKKSFETAFIQKRL